jgi:hypothetical protein
LGLRSSLASCLGHCQAKKVQLRCLRRSAQAGHADVVKFILAEDGFRLRPGKANADPREM